MFTQNYHQTGTTSSTNPQSTPAGESLPRGQAGHHFPAWLTAAITPDEVCASLRRHVPAFAAGQLRLEQCVIKRLRYQAKHGVWSGSYLLTIAGLTPGQSQVIPLEGTLLPPGAPEPAATQAMPVRLTPAHQARRDLLTASWGCYLPDLRLVLHSQPQETELAALPQLLDPKQARRLLEESMRVGGAATNYGELQIAACTPKVMRYKPGNRCTVLYNLEHDAPPQEQGWPEVVVAKTYNGEKGSNAFAAMQALWASPLQRSSTVTIAEPLAYVPELNVLVQGPIQQEATLKEAIRQMLHAPQGATPAAWDEVVGYLRKTAIGLAELHRCGVQYGTTITWEDELAAFYTQRAALATPLPALGEWATELVQHLQALAAACPADPLAPAHSSFRPAQVLLHQGNIGFIDFDGFCQAEPAMDLALFLRTIQSIAINKPTAMDDEEEESEPLDDATRLARLVQAEKLCALFLAEYEQHAPVSRTRILLWETLNLVGLVLNAWNKLKLGRLDDARFMLERHLQINGLPACQ